MKDYLLDYAIYLGYRVFEFMINSFPKRLTKHILYFISLMIYYLGKKHYRISKINLDLAFGNSKTDLEKNKIIKHSLLNMVYNIYEFVILQNQSFNEMEKKVELINEEYIIKLLEENKRIIIVTGHYGCWEFTLPFFALKYNPLTIISRKLNNKYLNNIFLKARDKQNLQMCEKSGAMMCVVKAMKQNRVVAFTIDQSINQKQSVKVKFFGHDASQVDSPIRLASKFDAVILPLFTITDGFENHKIIFKKPITVKSNMSEKEIQMMSQSISNILEAQVKQKPSGWFWQHRRWKLYYSKMYKK